jgi:hypothetical protein
MTRGEELRFRGAFGFLADFPFDLVRDVVGRVSSSDFTSRASWSFANEAAGEKSYVARFFEGVA